MRDLVTTYTFDASAKTILASDFALYGFSRILMIVNLTRGVVIYNPANTATKGALAGSVLTLDFDTTAHADTDALQIFVDDTDNAASEQTAMAILMALTALSERLDVYPDGTGALRTNVTNSPAVTISSGTVTTVATLTTAGTLNSIGVSQIDAANLFRNQHIIAAVQQVSSLFVITP